MAAHADGVGRRSSDLLHGRRGLQAGLLLTGPLGWLVIAYLGSLAVLFVAAFWRWTTSAARSSTATASTTSSTLWHGARLPDIALRTIGVAAAVTVTDALLAFPIAFFMAKVATPRARARCSSWRC